MGGNNPATLPKSQTAGSGQVRVHENKGEVHFHDDANNRKVATPVAEYDQKWAKCKKELTPVSFIDGQRQTIATLTPKIDKGQIDIEIEVEALAHSATFDSLDKLGN